MQAFTPTISTIARTSSTAYRTSGWPSAARRAGLWILTDRMLSIARHDYDQIWWLPLKRNQAAAFRPEEIVIDPAARSIKTRRTASDTWWSWDQMRDITVGNVNLSMYQFSDASLQYVTSTRKDNAEMYDWRRVDVRWQGTGDQQVVTAPFPRRPTRSNKPPDGTENDLATVRSLPSPRGTMGFEEPQTPEGVRVAYLAAANRNAALEAEGVRINGEALLLVRGPAAGEPVTGQCIGLPQHGVRRRRDWRPLSGLRIGRTCGWGRQSRDVHADLPPDQPGADIAGGGRFCR